MTTMRSSANVIELARDLMAVLAPVTGTRGTGKVLIKPLGNESVYLPRNWPVLPVVNGAAREDLLFKIGEGPNAAVYPNGVRVKADDSEPDASSWWAIPPGGAVVNVHSVIGGKRHNLQKGTKFIFDPVHPSLDVEAVLQAAITDGADPTHFGGCKSVVQFEQLAGPMSVDTFRSEVGDLPAIVIVWDGSEPADGTTQSSIDRGRTRVGAASQLFKERFNLFVLSRREDSGHLRRCEGLKLLDDASGWLNDRQQVDGQVFSAPTGIQIRGRSRVAGNNDDYQGVYVYLLQLSVTNHIQPYDDRTFNPWLTTHHEMETYAEDQSGGRKKTVDQDIDMTT